MMQLELEEDRRKFAENSLTQVAKEQAYKRRYDTFEDRRDKAISRHYEQVILPRRSQVAQEEARI